MKNLPKIVDIYSDTYKIYYSTRNINGCSIPMCMDVFKHDLKKYCFVSNFYKKKENDEACEETF